MLNVWYFVNRMLPISPFKYIYIDTHQLNEKWKVEKEGEIYEMKALNDEHLWKEEKFQSFRQIIRHIE